MGSGQALRLGARGCRYAEPGALLVADVMVTKQDENVFIQESKSGKLRHIPFSPEGRDFSEQAI